MKKLRIAMVVDVFPTLSETFITNQINSLIDEGHSVQIFSFNKGNMENQHSSLKIHNLLSKVVYFQDRKEGKTDRFFEFLQWSAKNFFQIRWQEFLLSLNFLKNGKNALSLDLFSQSKWFLSGKSFDIVHAHFGPVAERIALLKSNGFLRDSKLISTFHGFDLIPDNTGVYRQTYKFLLEESAAFTVNSEYLRNILLSLKPDKDVINILPVGLDTSFFKRTNSCKDKNHFELLFCGRLIQLKGPDISVDIITELFKRGHKNLKLTIIGDGPLKNRLLEKIRTNHLEKNVFLLGALSQNSIREEMEKAHVFLLPGTHESITNRAETQGLVLQEAQAMELPVVISDVGGMKYGIVPNQTGFVIKEGDISAFADAIEILIEDKILRESMGKGGRQYVVANFDNKILGKKLLDIYYRVLN